MTWSVEQVMRWLDTIEPRVGDRDPFAWLELPPSATAAHVQPAYHAIARNRHPDLFRNRIGATDFDRLVRAFAKVTAAYAELRDPARFEAATRKVGGFAPGSQPIPIMAQGTATTPRTAAGPARPRPAGSAAPDPDPSRAMNPRALTYYRRAEGALRLGDRTTALLQLRMAVAADPSSELLRAALAELLQGD